MRGLMLVGIVALALSGGTPTATAQTASCPGIFVDNACYVGTDGGAAAGTLGATPYWPTNNETAYYYGPYAVAPGFGPYLHLGGESGWNPNIGTTYNSYPPGDYYTDYGLPSLVWYPSWPVVVRTFPSFRYPLSPWTSYPFRR